MEVNEYAASQMRYWCRTNDFGGVGYSQPGRHEAFDNSNWLGWLTGPGQMDCSAGVADAYNIAFHNCGEPYAYFPRSTWTGSLVADSEARGFVDIGDSWTGSTPPGGFCVGDLILAKGHVVMVVRNGDDSFSPDSPDLAEAWSDSMGDIYGSYGADGSTEDDTGFETRVINYADHPFTQNAAWTTCLRWRGASAPAPAPQASRGRVTGIDISDHQSGIDISQSSADFVVVKATEGSGYIDPSFTTHTEGVLASGKRLGFYHFSWPGWNSVEEEVKTFVNAIQPYLKHKPFLYLDWEDSTAWWNVDWAKQFLDEVTRRTGIKPYIYMSASVAEAYDWESVAETYWLWAAGYPSSDLDSLRTPDCPYAPFSHGWWLLAWQYSSTGRIPGYSGDVDLNVCYRPDVLSIASSGSTPSESSTEEDWLNMPSAVDYLRAIADAVTPGKEGVKFDGELYNKVKETHNTLLRVERLLQEGGKKSVYNRLDDIEHYIASLDGQLNEIRQLLKNNDKKTEA